MVVELRDYQQKVIDDLKQAFSKGYNAPCLVLPCGSGKSIIAGRVIENANKKRESCIVLNS